MQQQNYKIVISGPVGAGKTTAIAALSDVAPVVTDARPSDEVAKLKSGTTVAMDYGMIDLGTAAVHLYGTPGQERFDFMWDIMLEGALGLILLINNRHADPLGDLRRFLDAYASFIATMPFCVGVTHMDMRPRPPLAAYHEALERRGYPTVPVFSVDGRSRQDMNLLLMAMLGMIEPAIVADTLQDARGTH